MLGLRARHNSSIIYMPYAAMQECYIGVSYESQLSYRSTAVVSQGYIEVEEGPACTYMAKGYVSHYS